MPIDIATGDVELARDDFVLPGRVPLKWTRRYRSALLSTTNSPLGPGWLSSWFPTLKRGERNWKFISPEGEESVFPDPDNRLERGQVIRLFGAFLELVLHDKRYIVTQWDVESGEIQRFVFAESRATEIQPLAAVENVSGDGVDVSWEASGRLKSLHQRIENRTVMVNYSPAGRVSSLALVTKDGKQAELVRYDYDKAGRLSAAFDPRGLANRYEYDAKSRISREMLKDGAVYSYHYDEKGRCIRFTGLDHYNEKRVRFVEAANAIIVTNSYGKSTTYERTASGQIAGEVDPSGNQRRTEFDEHNRVLAEVDPTGATTRYTYDERGNRNSITDPLGNIRKCTFNAHHQPETYTDPLGNRWSREYNADHRLVATVNPMGARWTIDYDAAGNPVAIIDPLGTSRQQRYVDGLIRERTDGMGHVTRFMWDEFGKIIERIGPLGERTTVKYDPVGNPVEVHLPDGGRLRATYDGGDNLNSFTNSKGYTTRLRYGSCRRLLECVDAIGRIVRFVWGTEPKRLDAIINQKGEMYSYFRNDRGVIVRERSFSGREQLFDYDGAGRCVAYTNGNGEKIQFKRNLAGWLTEQILPDGTSSQFGYDPVGRIVTAVNQDAAVAFEYDAAGQLVRELQGEDWVRTDYDAAGEVTRTLTNLGHSVNCELDANGRVRKLSTGNNQILAFERDPSGLETGRQMPGRVRLEQRFDSMGRLLAQRVGQGLSSSGLDSATGPISRIPTGSEAIRRDYRYDLDGLLLSIIDKRWGATDCTYDPVERILSALHEQGLHEHFEFDATDNLTRSQQQGHDSSHRARDYGSGDLLIQRDDTRYEHDLEGRLVRKTEFASSEKPQVWEYTWDPEGQLRKLRRPNGDLWEYRYDAFGRRVAKHGPTSTREFLWNGDVLIHEREEGEHLAAWVTMRGRFVPLAKVHEGALISVVADHLGTPREMLDASGKVVWAARWTAFGQPERKHVPCPEHDCPFRFQGQYFDEESGLHYNRFRYYDPSDAKFISPDPVRLAGGLNLYQYVHNPIGWVDPLGLTGDPAKATHITYEGVKDGKPYIGYASMPGLGHTPEEVLAYRYPNTDHFDVAPQAFYVGDGQAGKNTARGLEQRVFEDRGGLAGTSNKQNPVGEGNPNRDAYLEAADKERAKKPCAD